MIAPALPVPLWVLTLFEYNPYMGLKPTKEEALPPGLLNRLLKQTAKERRMGFGDCRYLHNRRYRQSQEKAELSKKGLSGQA